MKKIKVLHLIHQLGSGGAENGIINLVNYINQDLFETSICAFVGNGVQTERINRNQTNLFELNKSSGNDFTIPLRLWKLFRRWKPHIVHTHAWGTLVEGIIGAKLAGAPIIVHGEHGTIQQKPMNIIVQRFFWGMTDQILSVSRMHREKLAKIIGYPKEKIRVIINGVDTERFSCNRKNKSIRKALGIREEEVVIGTVGRLVPVKNQVMLIQAFAGLVKNYSNVKLLVVGDGHLREELILLASSLEISAHVMFLGKRSDIPDILQAMDIFVLSSISEGMSNTILEAMSSGLPVVATDVGGNSEIVDQNISGILVDSGNIDALAYALTTLIKYPDKRNDMGQAGRRRVEKLFSLQTMVSNYEQLYLNLFMEKLSKLTGSIRVF